jgi:branched-chain amino acid transport system ATP-binding protein
MAAILECEGLTKRFGGLAAVNDLSFAVEESEIYGIAGPNGAGKSTLFNLIAGHLPLTSGHVRFGGREITGLPAYRVFQLGIARTFQTPTVFGSLSVRENVLVGAYFGRQGRGLPSLRFGASARDAAEALRLTDLESRADASAALCSVFEKKRLMMASALASKPRVLLLDEPVGGLNAAEIDELMSLIRRIRASGVTVVLIEHVMRALVGLADRVLILHHGEKIFEGLPSKLRDEEQVVRVYLGGALPAALVGNSPGAVATTDGMHG